MPVSGCRSAPVVRVILGSMLAACALLVACEPPKSAEDASVSDGKRRPNVLLLVLDACRPDRMGYYGYERDTTPAMDALSRHRERV